MSVTMFGQNNVKMTRFGSEGTILLKNGKDEETSIPFEVRKVELASKLKIYDIEYIGNLTNIETLEHSYYTLKSVIYKSYTPKSIIIYSDSDTITCVLKYSILYKDTYNTLDGVTYGEFIQSVNGNIKNHSFIKQSN